MNIDDYYLLSNIPSLDLHGYDREGARVAINDFIRDNQKQDIEICQIIHGIGEGIIKNTTREVLNKNKNIDEFKISYFNPGITIIKIKKSNKNIM